MKSFNWLDTFEYPFKPNKFRVGKYTMNYVDDGSGSPIVFVHGTPSWSFEYRVQIKKLAKTHRCLAPDHIGFGLSDKPADYPYTLQQHAQNFEEWLEHLNLDSITLVVHDFGGPIGLHYAQKYPHKIKQLIILNTWMWAIDEHPAYKKALPVLKSPLLPVLYKYLNFSPKVLIPSSFGNKKNLSKKVHRQYTAPFSNPSERMGTIGFARELVNAQDFFRNLWENRATITDKPTLFIWGMRDKFITSDFLQSFIEAFPHHHKVELPLAGHFPQEEEADAVTQAMLTFLGE